MVVAENNSESLPFYRRRKSLPMSSFTISYIISGSDQKPQESLEADSLTEAGEIIAARFETPGAIVVPHMEELIVIPKDQVALCNVRQVQERRRAPTRTRNPFEAPEEEFDATPNF